MSRTRLPSINTHKSSSPVNSNMVWILVAVSRDSSLPVLLFSFTALTQPSFSNWKSIDIFVPKPRLWLFSLELLLLYQFDKLNGKNPTLPLSLSIELPKYISLSASPVVSEKYPLWSSTLVILNFRLASFESNW